jgi:hypothetical protein
VFLKISGTMLDAFAAIRARHAGRRRLSRNVVIPGAAFSRFWEAAHTVPPIAKPRPRRSKTPTLAVEIVIGGARKAPAAAVSRKTG